MLSRVIARINATKALAPIRDILISAVQAVREGVADRVVGVLGLYNLALPVSPEVVRASIRRNRNKHVTISSWED